MNKSHAGLWLGISVFFIAAVYSIVLFLLKSQFELTDWVLYGATMLAFLLTGVQTLATARSGAAVVLDTVLGIMTVIYLVIQAAGGTVGLIIGGLPLTPVLVAEIILLAIYLVITFSMYAAQSGANAQHSPLRRHQLLESDILGMMDAATDPAVKQALKGLAEVIHFSDNASLPGLADVDNRIASSVAMLQGDLIEAGADPMPRIEAIHRLIKERDRTAAILRR